MVKYSDCQYSLVLTDLIFFAKAPAVLYNIAFALSVHITAQSQKTFSIAMKILLTTHTPEKIPLSITPTRRPQMMFRELWLYPTLPWCLWMSRIAWNLKLPNLPTFSLTLIKTTGRLNDSFLDLPSLKVTGKCWDPGATFTLVTLVYYLMLSF